MSSSDHKPSSRLDPLAVFQLLREQDLEPGRARKLGSSAAYRALCPPREPAAKKRLERAVTRGALGPNR